MVEFCAQQSLLMNISETAPTKTWQKIYNLDLMQNTGYNSATFGYSANQDLLEYLEEHYSQI